MKTTILLKSRYGDEHYLERVGQKDSKVYLFVPSIPHYRVGFDENNPNVFTFVDPPGGPFLSVGSFVEEANGTIKSIKSNNGNVEIEFE